MLLHKGSFRERTAARNDFGWRGNNSGAASFDQMQPGKADSCKLNPKSQGNFNKTKICKYCHKTGHWKADCPVLQTSNKEVKPNVKPHVVVVPVGTSCVSGVLTLNFCEPDVLAAYAPVIRDSFVSLVGSNVKVLIKILRDTGAFG